MTARRIWTMGFVVVAGWLVMGLGTCARAEALTVTGSARTAQLQQWADGSILPLPPTTIDVVDGGACPNQEWFVSCAYGDRSQVYLWVDANRRIWLHEVWHILEYQEFTDGDREQASALMGLAGQPWRSRPQTQTTDPIECFAQVASELSVFRKANPRRYRYEPCVAEGMENRRPMRQLIRRALAG